MLVLTRKLDETIRIGDDIKVTVLRVKGNTVRIGIEAPKAIRVVRDELDRHESAAPEVATPGATVAEQKPPRMPAERATENRVFVGKMSTASGTAELNEQPADDQAAPLRAFLRNGRGLQVAG